MERSPSDEAEAAYDGRVLLVTKGLDLGGLERVVVDLAIGLLARKIDVEVAVVNPRRRAFVPMLDAAGVRVHELGGHDVVGVRAARRLRAIANDPRFDVVHVHGPFLASVVRFLGPQDRIVTTAHAPWASLRLRTRVVWRSTARRDAVTIAVSQAVADTLPARSVEVISHGIDVDHMQQHRRAHGDPPERPPHERTPCSFVTVAGHRDAKDYPNLLRAMRHAVDLGANLRVTAVGDGPDVGAHRALAQALGVDNVIEFRPSTVDALELIAAADVLVVASRSEGQPLVVSEALALGTPVVATDVGTVRSLVDASVGRVVPPGDPIALGAAVAELAQSRTLRDGLAAATTARHPVRTLDDVVDDHLAVYRSLAAPVSCVR